MKPTLKMLESKYSENETLKQPFKRRLAVEIEYSLAKNPRSIVDFIDTLSRNGINVVLRQSKEGQIYGITYVDIKTKCVFNGSDLGKGYSAKGVLERLGYLEKQALDQSMREGIKDQREGFYDESLSGSENELLGLLMRTEYNGDQIPVPYKKDVKKKKGKRITF